MYISWVSKNYGNELNVIIFFKVDYDICKFWIGGEEVCNKIFVILILVEFVKVWLYLN